MCRTWLQSKNPIRKTPGRHTYSVSLQNRPPGVNLRALHEECRVLHVRHSATDGFLLSELLRTRRGKNRLRHRTRFSSPDSGMKLRQGIGNAIECRRSAVVVAGVKTGWKTRRPLSDLDPRYSTPFPSKSVIPHHRSPAARDLESIAGAPARPPPLPLFVFFEPARRAAADCGRRHSHLVTRQSTEPTTGRQPDPPHSVQYEFTCSESCACFMGGDGRPGSKGQGCPSTPGAFRPVPGNHPELLSALALFL